MTQQINDAHMIHYTIFSMQMAVSTQMTIINFNRYSPFLTAIILDMNQLFFNDRVNTEPAPTHQYSNSWTDQRIEEIKKKYNSTNRHNDVPPHPFQPHNDSKRNRHDRILKTEGSGPYPQTQFRGKRGCLSQSIDKQNLPTRKDYETAKFATGKTPLKETAIERSSNAGGMTDGFCLKSSIKQKLVGSATDQHFYRKNVKQIQVSQFVNSGRDRHSGSKLPRRELNDPRISNIQKINSKITRILECIDHCEQEEFNNHNNHAQNINYRMAEGAAFLGDSNRQRYNHLNQSSKKLQYNSRDSPNIQYPNGRPAQVASYFASIERDGADRSRMRGSRSNSYYEQNYASYKNDAQKPQTANNYASVSSKQTPKAQPSNLSSALKRREVIGSSNGRPYVEKSQQIDREIDHFQYKIAELQEAKKKMNIQFKPFHFDHSPIEKRNADPPPTTHHPIINPAEFKARDQNNLSKYRFDSPNRLSQANDLGQSRERQQRIINNASYHQNLDNQLAEHKMDFRHLNQQHQTHFQQPQTLDIQYNRHAQSYLDHEQLRKSINDRMEERKKRIQMLQLKTEHDHTHTAKLMVTLCEQIKLDEKLRNSKNWYHQCHHPDKLKALHRQLWQRGLEMTGRQIENAFSLAEDENDPFFSFREESHSFATLVADYVQSKDYWEQTILHHWNTSQLLDDQQLIRELDYDHKSFICIEDLVRVLNMQSTTTFYRNRDLFLIYERFRQGKEQVTLQQLMGVLGKDY